MVLAILALSLYGCKRKPALTDDDVKYIRTTIALMRVRTGLQPSDSTIASQRLDSVYRAHSTSKEQYIAATDRLGNNDKHAELVYKAIKDSLGLK